ncbi:MAG: fructose 1,6-bisphosphatase [Sphingobacteriales bacterium]|jgi:tRNA U34 5-carboxymethylaminomethyl modifying GTPase MnmE/TrmE|nr:MAG: fructose 1,6-bisphosphatase [Sphingobacteriales bacterium]
MSKNQHKDSESALPIENNIEASTATNHPESASRIEAIKNLIFGENIQQIDSDFQTLRNEIDKKKEDLENYIAQVNKELSQTIDNLETDLNIRITELDSKTNDNVAMLTHKKVDRKYLGELLVNMGENILKDY